MKVDLFSAVHKAIRTIFYETGLRLQVTDMLDPVERNAFLEHIERLLTLIKQHGHHEDELIFPAICKPAPGALQLAAEQHAQCELKLTQLQEQIQRLRDVRTPAACLDATSQLNRAYTDFVAYYLEHMNTEEATCLPASLEYLEEKELLDIRFAIQQSMTPAEYAEWLNYILPSLTINELVPLLKQTQQNAPAAVWAQVFAVGGRRVEHARWQRACQLAGVAIPSA